MTVIFAACVVNRVVNRVVNFVAGEFSSREGVESGNELFPLRSSRLRVRNICRRSLFLTVG
jgi:hypothetical protein